MMKNSQKLFISVHLGLFLSIWVMGLQAQSFYHLDTIQEIRLYFTESDWDARLDSLKKNNPDGRLIASYAMLNGQRFDSVGVRYKGNSTYSAARIKNPFNIKLDYIRDDQNYQGYNTLKLSNGFMDPSFLREVMAYSICRKYLPASQANFIKVFVNDVYVGLYTNVENTSNDFLSKHYFHTEGAFFQCDRTDVSVSIPTSCMPSNPGSALRYTSPDSLCYFNNYEKESDHGWSDLLDLLKTLNQNPSAIAEVLNVDRALWMLALNNVFVNLDSYLGSGHNYLIYQMENKRFQTIPWDLNEFYGAFTNAGTGAQLNIQQMRDLDPLLHLSNPDRPLISKILSQTSYQKRYLAHVQTILDEIGEANSYESLGLKLQQLIRESVIADNNKFFTNAAFEQNLSNDFSNAGGPGGGKVYPGLIKFTNERLSFLSKHAKLNVVKPTIEPLQTTPNMPSRSSTIQFRAKAQNAQTLFLFYRFRPEDVFTPIAMWDDGLHGDDGSNDLIFGTSLSMNGNQHVEYYYYAENDNIAALKPVRAEYEFYQLQAINEKIEAGAIIVNELVASNAKGAKDEQGEFEDWIELFNATDLDISMAGLYLSDNTDNPLKWEIPDTIIRARSFMIVWADEDGKDVGLHANFKLSKSGEQVMLYNADSSLVDQLVFPAVADDESYGRCPLGNQKFNQPTFASFNACTVNNKEAFSNMQLFISPNPCYDQCLVHWAGIVPDLLEVINLQGVVLQRFETTGHTITSYALDFSSLSSGLYFLRAQSGSYQTTLKVLHP